MNFRRVFAMPSAHTFQIKHVREWVEGYVAASKVSIDPFARDSALATYTNDIDPSTRAWMHVDAETFCTILRTWRGKTVKADLAIFDPPYSPRQISECYRGCGLDVDSETTQNSAMYKRVRDALDPLIVKGGVVLSFGWNSSGMGKGRGYEIIDVLLVNHGGAHNDTICIAEKKL